MLKILIGTIIGIIVILILYNYWYKKEKFTITTDKYNSIKDGIKYITDNKMGYNDFIKRVGINDFPRDIYQKLRIEYLFKKNISDSYIKSLL